MTFRRPLKIVGDALFEMSDSDISVIRNRVIVNHGRDQGFKLSVVSTGGSLDDMIDTRRMGGAISQTDSAAAGATVLNSITYDKIHATMWDSGYIAESDLTTTRYIRNPVYYESDGNAANMKIRSMTDSDFKDTFIRPVIDQLVDGTTGNNRQGVFYITSDSTASDVISSTPVFIDTVADIDAMYGGGATGNLNLPEDSDQPKTYAKYYLARVGLDSGLAPLHDSNYFPLLRIDPDSSSGGGQSHIRLKEMDSNTLDHHLLSSLKWTEKNDSFGWRIRYEIDSENTVLGNQVGTSILDRQFANQRIFSNTTTGYFQALPYGDSFGAVVPTINNTYKLKIRKE